MEFYARLPAKERPREWTPEELAALTGLSAEECSERMGMNHPALVADATPPAPPARRAGLLTAEQRDAIIRAGSGVAGWPRDLGPGGWPG
jgi:hypothetical protein